MAITKNLDSTNQSLVAIAARDGTIQLFNMDVQGAVNPLLALQLDFIPKALHFGLCGRDLSIFALEGGHVYVKSLCS